VTSPTRAAADARRALKAMARPAGAFDARRYFRGSADLRFYNVGTEAVRALAKSIYRAHRDDWSLADAVRFATVLIVDPHLEVKTTGIELLARYRSACTPRLLPVWKRWLANNHASNWATTDAICAYLIGPLIVAHPSLVPIVGGWTRHRNMWVRRAAAVSLIAIVRKGAGLDAAYAVARRLHPDREDLIQKAVGWLLREAGKTDPARLEAYLRQHGPSIPRTTVRYAIERMPAAKRREVLSATKAPAAMPARKRASAQRARHQRATALSPSRSNATARAAGGGAPGAVKDVGPREKVSNDVTVNYGPRPSRFDKLGVKKEWRVSALGANDKTFLAELEGAVAELSVGRPLKDSDAIFFGATKEAELARLAKLKVSLTPNGALWIIRPKARPEISERAVMAAGKAAGLVDVKVVSFSPTHTAEKFVIPVRDRRSG